MKSGLRMVKSRVSSLRCSCMTAQRGVVLIIALIVLVAMSMAGIGLMRSVGNGVAIAGNLSLKQATTAAGEYGLEQGRVWLKDQFNSSLNNDAGGFYFSTYNLAFDPVGAASYPIWKAAKVVPVAGTPFEGMDIRYVVHRMCEFTGVTTDSCVRLGVNQIHTVVPCLTLNPPCKIDPIPYYRITTRVIGPKNTVSYLQLMVY